jgi:hypothetical protein
MKSNYNNKHHDRHSLNHSSNRSYDDFNVLEPAPDIDLTLPDDEDEELSDYTLMDNAVDLDYEE